MQAQQKKRLRELTGRALRDSADLIERGWIQFSEARSKSGFPVRPINPSAVSWCPVGAVDRAVHDLHKTGRIADDQEHSLLELWISEALRLLEETLAAPDIIDWNDEPQRTQSEVSDALRSAADLFERRTTWL